MIQSRLVTRQNLGFEEREHLSLREWTDPHIPHVLLATCNRTEVYWGDGSIPKVLARHLFRVAAGLESALIGECAIQGQIKRAYITALKEYGLSSSLNRLFQLAIHVGKRVRTETHISEGVVSYSQLTVEMLRRYDIDLKNKIVGIIGANKLTEDILKYLKARGAVNIYLSNRNIEKAVALSNRYGGTVMGLEKKRELLRLSQVLVCATSAPHTIINVDDLGKEWKKELIIFDLAFPRDVEHRVGEIPGVTLYNLEDMEHFARQNLSLRYGEIAKAEEIIEEELEKLEKWQMMRMQIMNEKQLSYWKETICGTEKNQ